MHVFVAERSGYDDSEIEGVYASLASAKAAYPTLIVWHDDGNGGCYAVFNKSASSLCITKHEVKD